MVFRKNIIRMVS